MNFFSTAFLALMAFCVVAEAVKFCYSGTDDKYREKECGLGVDNPLIMFWCQKYHCKDIDGGNIFTVRGCIYPGQDRCAAAQKQCAYQNGTLDCPTCETDLYASSSNESIVIRSCVPEGEKCSAQEQYCQQLGGTGQCFTCNEDGCNSAQNYFTYFALISTIFISYFI